MSRLVVVAPLRPGAEARARELLNEGPPFDLEGSEFESHEVFVTPQEVVFLFEGNETLSFTAGDPALLGAAKAWAECLDGRPRIARSAFFWKRDEASG